MKYTGAHVSAAGGVYKAPARAAEISANAMAIFTKNQKRWSAPPLKKEDVDQFKSEQERLGIRSDQIMPHASYLINLGNPDPEKRKKSYEAFLDEMQRVEQLGLTLLNFHPGAHLKQTDEAECVRKVAQGINAALGETRTAVAVVENTAGQGSWIGYRFEHLRDIIALVDQPSRVGVCLDTCHTHAGGYDLSTAESCETVFEEFGRVVGFDMLKGMHLNDSQSEWNSRVDRHASLGDGTIGLDAFRYIMSDPRFDNIPLILETPEPNRWAEEIELLRSFAE
ncbi:deoxyribonuclease IV [Salinispira pacifica]|uniref:Probable endonuclease 4 n=1 Tax=Salinispira pacifica TaxID=1307761 RepID=V5WGA2_9SPIO|nr:deoxyribonuclease IV [Salinispira pacifica]AHC14867.1 Endonuclease IV [Salinispira pacifica]